MLLSYFGYIAKFTKFTRGSCLPSLEKSKAEESPCKKKKERKKKQAQRRKKEYHFVKKRKKILRESDWYKLAELHAGVQISNKKIAVKPKFAIHDVKNKVSFSLCKHQP